MAHPRVAAQGMSSFIATSHARKRNLRLGDTQGPNRHRAEDNASVVRRIPVVHRILPLDADAQIQVPNGLLFAYSGSSRFGEMSELRAVGLVAKDGVQDEEERGNQRCLFGCAQARKKRVERRNSEIVRRLRYVCGLMENG